MTYGFYLDNTLSLPIGTIIALSFDNYLSDNLLLCDGSTFDETIYPELYIALGNSN